MSSHASSVPRPRRAGTSSSSQATSSAPPPAVSVAVLGLGPMGLPIARNLLASGTPTTVWNRTRSRADALAAEGAVVAGSVAEAAADVVLSVLPDVPQLRALLDEETVAALGAARTLLVVLSTTSAEQVRALGEELAPHGVRVLDAPMSGGVAGAAAGSLSLMVGGAEADVARARPVLEIIGGTLTHLGELGAGSVTKLCNQIVVAGTLASLGEAFGLARAGGIDPTQLAQVLGGGLAASEVLRQKQDKLLNRDYSLGGSTDNQVKDLLYASAAMDAADVPARLLPVLLAAFQELVDRGAGQQDHAVIQELFLPAEDDAHPADTV